MMALAEGHLLTESMARTICHWTDKIPAGCRDTADGILVAAARAGARREDLAALAMEIYARSIPDPDDDGKPEQSFEDRQVRVETTFDGAGVITGDLTPECAAVVTAVLESLSAPMGAGDTRTREQRYHDGLQEAMRWSRFCIMVGPWTTGKNFWRKPSSGRVYGRLSETYDAAESEPTQLEHRPRYPARLDGRSYLLG
jgi:Domain of unknown function (DUF222)